MKEKPLTFEENPERPLTYGEKAVRLTFNPSADPIVHLIKGDYAGIIDTLNERRFKAQAENNAEAVRLYSIAITKAKDAQLWAVEAITS